MGKAASTAAGAMSRPAAMGAASCRKIGKGITYYVRESNQVAAPPQGTARPLLLLFPWLGAHPQGVAKYFQAYSRTGCDMLVVETQLSHFLWPRWGRDYGAEVLEVLQSHGFESRPLLVHCFSIGGYTFTQLLVHVAKDAWRYRWLMDRIKGHVYDSLVNGSVERMAVGLGKVVFPRMASLVRWMVLFYLWLFKRYTMDILVHAVDVFWNSPVTVPALFFYCENDVMSDVDALEDLIDYWRKRGVVVQTRKWAESTHAGHLRRHPLEYQSALDNFLFSLNVTPLKAKM